MPAKTKPHGANTDIVLSDAKLTMEGAGKERLGAGKRLAPLLDVALNKEFLEANKGAEFFVRWPGPPSQKGSDWYYIDRKSGSMVAIGKGVSETSHGTRRCACTAVPMLTLARENR